MLQIKFIWIQALNSLINREQNGTKDCKTQLMKKKKSKKNKLNLRFERQKNTNKIIFNMKN